MRVEECRGTPFQFIEPDLVRELLHAIDFHGGGELKAISPVANPATRDTYLINSLIEEAITSSQLEGAATTRRVAKHMLREKRKPRDRSERMILNNYQAMEFLGELSEEDLALVDLGLMTKAKLGRAFVFNAVPQLAERLDGM